MSTQSILRKISTYLYFLKIYIKGSKNLGTNFFKAILFRFGIINKINCVNSELLGEGGEFELLQKNITPGLVDILVSLDLDKLNEKQKNILVEILSQIDEKILFIDGVRIANMEVALLIENFVLCQFDIKIGNSETIIDIGANRADSTLFFANRNYNVLGFEPVKKLFDQAVENVNLNKDLKDKIKLVNKAVSCKNGTTKIYFNDDLDNNSGDSSQYLKNKGQYEVVETINIESIIKEYNITPYILKMDCEGCEYDIILNSDLSMFKEIYFEYHGCFTNINSEVLIKKLEEQGFKLVEKEEFPFGEDLGIAKMARI